MYGLPKVHKAGYPIRPIISATGTYSYKLAKYLDSILKPLLNNNRYIITDTFDFVNRVAQVTDSTLKMGSFDVESLFTNVPVKETIEIVLDRAYAKSKLFHGIERVDLKKLLGMALQKSHFHFCGQVFDQIDGVSMGSPLAPLMAQFFMDEFENKFMPQLEQAGVRHWWRYVDDIFVLVKPGVDIEYILDLMNTLKK